METFVELCILRSPVILKSCFQRLACVSMCAFVSLSVYVCACVCYLQNSKTNYSKNSNFSILLLHHNQMIRENFYEDRANSICTEEHKRIGRKINVWSTNKYSNELQIALIFLPFSLAPSIVSLYTKEFSCIMSYTSNFLVHFRLFRMH